MTSMVTEVLGIINNAVVDTHVQEFVLCFYNKFVCVCGVLCCMMQVMSHSLYNIRRSRIAGSHFEECRVFSKVASSCYILKTFVRVQIAL